MTTVSAAPLLDLRTVAGVRVVRLPALVRGRVRMPEWPRVGDIGALVAAGGSTVAGPTDHGSYLLARPVLDRDTLASSGQTQILVLPAIDPRELREPDPAEAVLELARLPHHELTGVIDAVGAELARVLAAEPGFAAVLSATSRLADRAHHALLDQLPRMFDGVAVRRMTARALGTPGVAALDGWQPVPERPVQGITARMAAGLGVPGTATDPAGDDGSGPEGSADSPPLLRALPTTQLHLTAGNTPVVPVTSLLWGWAVKGACVVKPAAALTPLLAPLAAALTAAGADHPLVRHTTIAYWPGGDRGVEDVLLADGAFDRRLVWGAAETVRSVSSRGGATDTVVMRPRQAVSIIGREAVADDWVGTVRRAAADVVVADQQACMSSLLHLVEGTDADVDAYARALRDALAAWDAALPHALADAALGRLVELRRGLLASARWHCNGTWPQVSSAVAVLRGDFDLRRHPGGRLVLVRRVDDLRHAVAAFTGDVSHVGVAPVSARDVLRDALAARGVDNVLPLGEAERTYAGRPQDGVQILDRLVRWVNA